MENGKWKMENENEEEDKNESDVNHPLKAPLFLLIFLTIIYNVN